VRALVKPHAGPGLELRDVPEPTTGPGEVKIRVMRAGLCGTDLHIESWDDFAAEHVSPGQIIGHEFYGEIVEIGEGVEVGEGRDDALRLGLGVSVEGHIVCGRCRNCKAGKRHVCVRTNSIGVDRDGGFADFVVVPASNVWVPATEIDPALGAVLDPFGNAVHTATQFRLMGEDVLVTGAGPIGIMAALIACHANARHLVLTDISDDRLELARKAAAGVGELVTVNTARESFADVMERLEMTEGFDVCLEMSGSAAAMAGAIDHCRHGAKIAMLGLPARPYEVNWNKVISHMLTIKGVYGREMFETWYQASSILSSSRALRDGVRSTITHVFTPENFQEAFDTARSGRCGKVTIDWTTHD